MKPVVAYRHKLGWKLWRLWQAVRQQAASILGAVISFLILAVGLALTIGAYAGLRYLAPRHQEHRTGEVVATGPVRASEDSTPIALVRVGAEVFRFEMQTMAGCRIGDHVDVRQTYRAGRGGPRLVRTELVSGCRPLP